MLNDLVNTANYSYSPFTWPPLIVGVTIAIIGSHIAIRERISRVSLAFAALAYSASLWLVAGGIALCARTPESALAWYKVESLGVVLMPAIVVTFALLALNQWRRYSWAAGGCFFLSGVFYSQILLGNRLLSGVRLYTWGYYHLYGPIGQFFLFFFAAAIGLTFYLFWTAYRDSPSGVHKLRHKVFLQSLCLGLLGSVDFLPCFNILTYPAGFLPAFTFFILAGQAIARFHFTDITPAFAASEIVQTMPGYLLLLDPDGKIRMANKGVCNFLGKAESDLVGLPIKSLASVSLRPEQLETFIAEGIARDIEIIVTHRTLGPRTMSVSASIMKDTAQEPLAYVCVARDITDRQRAEQGIKLYGDIVNNINTGIVVLRMESLESELSFRIVDANPAASAIAGMPFTEVLGKTFYESFPNAFSTPMPGIFAKVVRTGQKQDLGEVHYGDARVPENYFSVAAFPLPNQSVGIAFSNVTQRKLMEETLRQSELRFRRLLESNIIGFVLVDFDGRMIEANDAFLKMLGYTREDLWAGKVGNSDMTPPEYRYIDQWMLERVRTTGACSPVEKEYIRKNGSRLSVLVGVVRLEETGQQCLCFVIDATERRKALDELEKSFDEMEQRVNQRTLDLSRANEDLHREVSQREAAEHRLMKTMAELARSNKELEEFAYVVSHDLQEPLRKVVSYIDLLMHRYKGKIGPEADKFIHYIVDGSVRMRQMISDLLTYSRVGREDLAVEDVVFEEAVKEALSNLEAALQESQATVTIEPLPTLKANRPQIVQLFQNLIGNAVKFKSSRTPAVRITSAKQNGEWRFAIQDNGIGIDPEFADRIFAIFQRLHTRAEYPGTGIGLAIAKKVVERHGGRIWMESAPGKGTTFYFTIAEALNTLPPNLEVAGEAPAPIDIKVLP